MREINRDPGLAGIMGWWPLEAGPGVSLMSWPDRPGLHWLLLSALQTSVQWRRDARSSHNQNIDKISEQLFSCNKINVKWYTPNNWFWNTFAVSSERKIVADNKWSCENC